ncbi:LppU/SCO3897 family protein [Actinokineospora sp. HUAS TT18]|uniref:LppU/SCO3897 family protein n=1 Tax=Actinokineospora sp. HUAS TT18 TaxID=3447451 RepID=UPI003F5251AA
MSETVDQEPAAVPAGRKRLPIWVLALVAAVVLAGAGFGAYQLLGKDAAAPGECAAVEGADDTAKLTPADCADENATFKIASKKELTEKGCPDGAYRELRDDKNLICLLPNFIEGKCFAPDEKNQGFRIADCAGTETIRISRVINDTDDPKDCPHGNGIGYPDPPVVFCIETPGTS